MTDSSPTQATPKGLRLHIGLFGRRNVGKSSLLNALTRQSVSIVSDVAGTTTDPVEKPMELLPLGPVLFIDTAGVDDAGSLGDQRVARTRKVFDRTDVGVIVTEAGAWGEFEDGLLRELKGRGIPAIVVFNKSDLRPASEDVRRRLAADRVPCVDAVASDGQGVHELRDALLRVVPDEFLNTPSILGDLVPPGELAILVVPIDLEAPKGRLILAQVQSIRDLLDNDAYCMVVKEGGLRDALERLRRPPALVVCDSQAFLKVAADTPPDIPMTSFSILFARYKGDLTAFTEGAMAIDRLGPGDRVLITEACAHHPIGEDIGRVKIPRWLTQYVGGQLRFTHVQGHDFPDDLADYQLVVHCGACVHNRRAVLSRIDRCLRAGVPVTNYGMAIAFSLGVFERALTPFPAAKEVYWSKHNRPVKTGAAAAPVKACGVEAGAQQAGPPAPQNAVGGTALRMPLHGAADSVRMGGGAKTLRTEPLPE
jgi:[FeFe] hydrogenase H-cluster maturation GTPase HydF